MTDYRICSDPELTSLLKKGDANAFAEIYERYKGLLFVHAYRRLNNQEEAEDVLHDLFATLWNKKADLSIQSDLSGYLYIAVRNRIFKLIAHKKIKASYFSYAQTSGEKGYDITDHRVRSKQLAPLIEAEISALPPKMREIFILSRKENKSHKRFILR